MRINIDSIGDDLYNAYNEGFGDGMKEIIGIVEEFKETHKYNVGSQALLRELELYILKKQAKEEVEND